MHPSLQVTKLSHICCAHSPVLQQILDCPTFPQKAELDGAGVQLVDFGKQFQGIGGGTWKEGSTGKARKPVQGYISELVSVTGLEGDLSWDPLRSCVECAQNCSLRNGGTCPVGFCQGVPS